MAGNLDHLDPMFSRYPRPPLEIPSDLSRIPLEDIKQATNNLAQQNIIQKEYDWWMAYKEELSGKKLKGYVSRIPLEITIDVSRILLEDIKQATKNFAQQNIIEKNKYYDWTVYKGELSGKKLAFISIRGLSIRSSDLRVLSKLTNHQNVVSLIGFCYELHFHHIIVVEHLTRGGLDKYVSSTAHLTWLMRLKICLDIASTLHYLLNHRLTSMEYIVDLNIANIYLDENWQAKIQLITPKMLSRRPPNTLSSGQFGYADPSYIHTGRHKEIYSFGVILFELLCARPAVTYDEEGGEEFLSKLARSHYEKGTLTEIIDPVLRVQMNRYSITIFSELAYHCLNENQSIRPTISVVIEQLQKVLKLQQGFETSELQKVQNIQHMKIPLSEIRSATRDFTIPHKPGKVYKADLSHFDMDKFVAENKIKRVSMEEILEYPRRKSTVAIKSIDGGYGQRTEERLQTLLYLSHENLVKLVGFCDEDDGHIHAVYEYSNRSLDEYIHSQHINFRKYTNNPTRETMRNIFPWVIRLQFCLDAARGLNFLHNGNGTRVRLLPSLKFKRKNDTIIHGNIKSSNILISRDGVGMIGDFGLSTNEYSDIHKLTKEYDVYSFGLVLFEVLSGELTHFKISKDDPELLPNRVKRGFNQKELDNIIDPMLRQEFEKYRYLIGNRSAESLNMFATITYRCFQEKAKGRPTMADVVEELEKAYKYHVESLEQMQKDEDNSKLENLKHLKIPFKEIYSATNGFVDSQL